MPERVARHQGNRGKQHSAIFRRPSNRSAILMPAGAGRKTAQRPLLLIFTHPVHYEAYYLINPFNALLFSFYKSISPVYYIHGVEAEYHFCQTPRIDVLPNFIPLFCPIN
jgi:hypothetical protein